MKKYLLSLMLLLSIFPAFSQRTRILNDMKQELAKSKDDNEKVKLYADISEIYGYLNEDSCLYYATRGMEISQKINYPEGHSRILYSFGIYYLNRGKLPEALKCFIEVQQIAAKNNDKKGMARGLFGTGLLYRYIDIPSAIKHMLKARDIIKSEENGQLKLIYRIDINLGISYIELNQLDSAFIYLNGMYQNTSPDDFYYSPALLFFGSLQSKMGHNDEAIKLLKQSITVTQKDNDHYTATNSYYYLAEIYNSLKIPDSAIYFAQLAFYEAKQIDRKNQMLLSANLLARFYEPVNLTESHRYLKIARDINDEVYGLKKTQSMQKLVLEEQLHHLKTEQEQIEFKNRLRLYLFISGIIILLAITFILYRNNLQRKKINAKLETAFNNLKSTQSQLIQSEKMASLGELTAGIAHEIQNPLNFVNNFSEISNELVEEFISEKSKVKSERDEALEDEILNDISQNLQKINHHGKRAADIVKGMLQHSRTSSGQKEPTDINALADEYLRLAYHGLRAKDKTFNADFKTEFDPNLPKINVIPQDIGRVILNLINNAFYAVDKKAKENNENYKPLVVVETRLDSSPLGGPGGQGVKITIKDNGSGIPLEIKDKIFQPFFTTKPTGQGTGLGLSLSYDIVKAHGGEIKVNTKENEGTEFTIILPA